MQKLDMLTPDILRENIEALARLFPNIITEREDADGNIVKAIDYDLFKQMFSDSLVEWAEERYRLDWPGKRASILKANTPIDKTLRPIVTDSVNWDTTENLYIEWDNFEVLKVLQESYLGKVKMIYIDPPYNTGKDFVYTDDYSKKREEEMLSIWAIDEEENRLFKPIANTDTNGRFHSDWLSMMYERLVVARGLLRDDGMVFISIWDDEVSNLRKILDELFWEENFIAQLIWRKNKLVMKGDNTFKKVIEPVLVYGKNKSVLNFLFSFDEDRKSDFSVISSWYWNKEVIFKPWMLRFRIESWVVNSGNYTNLVLWDTIKIENFTNSNIVKIQWEFKWSQDKVYEKLENNAYILIKDIDRMSMRIHFESNGAKPLDYLDENYKVWTNESWKLELKKLNLEEIFSYPKPTSLVQFFMNIINDEDGIILDFFSWSATTAHAVMQLNAEDGGNRKFIMVQIPEETDKESEAYKAGYVNICEIGKERIRRAAKKILEENKDKTDIKKLDTGFRVYRLDSSNMKDVYYHPNDVSQDRLFEMESNIKEDRTPEDILAQVMLDLGLTLDLSIEKRVIHGSTVFYVAGNSLVACFDEHVDFALVDTIAQDRPLRVVLRDSSFSSDADRINFETRFAKLSPETDIRVI